MRFLLPFVTIVAALHTLPAFAATDASEKALRHARELFEKAYKEVDAPANAARHADSEALKAYPLYPYLQAARIRRAFADMPASYASVDQRAETFVTYHERDPVGKDLRRTWLASLAERSEWDTFLKYYRDDVADEALRCQSFTARIELSRTNDLGRDVAKQWLTPRAVQPCTQAFQWLRDQNLLTPALLEQRIRLALKDGVTDLARQLAVELPPERSAPLIQWAQLLDSPQRSIDALIASPQTPVEPEALLAGWTRFARGNRDGAMQRLDELIRTRGLDAEMARPYLLALAMPLAWDRRAEALQYFRRAAGAPLDDNTLEWQARSAMWAGDWRLVSESIAAMSAEARGSARWRYWTARAAAQGGDAALAQQLYESVLLDDNFYSAMAAARLGRTVAPHPEKLVVDKVLLEQLDAAPSLVRARELVLCELYPLALKEWQEGYADLNNGEKRQAIHLAARWGWYEQAILTAAQLRLFNDYALLYPRPFEREVRAAAELTDLPPEFIYSVLRQESLYRTDAVSAAGARGLLQLMPDTANGTARAWKRPRPRDDDLFNPAINVPLGAARLKTLIDRFGTRSIALAGYNAGPNAAARWLPTESKDMDVWIENIPYNETRIYVQRILWHNVVFSWLKSGEPQPADALLARVTPLLDPAVVGSR